MHAINLTEIPRGSRGTLIRVIIAQSLPLCLGDRLLDHISFGYAYDQLSRKMLAGILQEDYRFERFAGGI
jgi:hypothetical protein